MSGYTENAHWPQRHAGPGHHPAPKALHPALAQRKSAGSARYPTLPQEIQCLLASVTAGSGSGTSRQTSSPFRAQRFNLHLPLRYRPVGEQGWRKGTTENISRSGMLFHAEEDLQPNMQLEINLVLPAEIAGLAATEVVCRGEVVRTVETPGSKVMPALAAKILQYHFQHGSRVSQA